MVSLKFAQHTHTKKVINAAWFCNGDMSQKKPARKYPVEKFNWRNTTYFCVTKSLSDDAMIESRT